MDINQTLPKRSDSCCGPADFAFESFEQLTSLHVNSTDEKLLASGYSKDVALYDLGTGKRLQLFANIHREPINVAKFAYHSPFIFATSSFDHDVKMWDLRQNPLQPCFTASSARGNVTVCFSPDDLYLLVSAIDNEVCLIKQVHNLLFLLAKSFMGNIMNFVDVIHFNHFGGATLLK